MSDQAFGREQFSYGAIGRNNPTQRLNQDLEETSRVISNKIFKINGNASAIERLVRKIGTKEDDSSLRDKLHLTQQESNNLAAEITELMRNIASGRHDRQQRLQLDRLRASFKLALERYGDVQKKAQDRVKSVSLAASQYEIKEQDTWSDEAALIERERHKEQLQQQQLIVEDEVAIARDREERVRQIESDVLDVNEIFKQLGTMVHEQGEMVDDIEANVTRASDYVIDGNEQLQAAAAYQKSYRKKCCCLAVIVLVLGGILALILGLSLHKSK